MASHNKFYLVFLLICSFPAKAALLSPGDIAFTGWNADVNDAFSFVLLQDVAVGERIWFTDNEWDGSSFNSGEGLLSWTADAFMSAGAVVSLNQTNRSASVSANTGLVSGAIDLNASNEALFAFTGDILSPLNFLSAFSSDGASGFNTLSGTGLSLGLTAIDFNGSAGQDADIFEYVGARTGLSSYAEYLPLLNDVQHWLYQGGSGGQQGDGSAPDLPFDATPFSVESQAVPEPSSLALFFLTLVATVVTRLRPC